MTSLKYFMYCIHHLFSLFIGQVKSPEHIGFEQHLALCFGSFLLVALFSSSHINKNPMFYALR